MTIAEGARFPPIRLAEALRSSLPLSAAFVAVAGAGVLIPLLDQPLLVFVPIGVAAALALVARRIDLGIYFLIAATALNRYDFAVAGWNAKIENMAVLIVLVALTWRIASGRERSQRLPLALLFGSLLAVNILSSVLNSTDLYKSIRIVVRMGLAIATMYVISTYVSDRRKLTAGLRALLIVGAAASAFGLFALAVWYLIGQDLGVQQNPINNAVSPTGTLWEGNIFGSYVAGAAVLSGALLLAPVRTVHRGLLSAVFALALAALVLSLARGAWVGFGAGSILAVLFLRRARFHVALAVVGVVAVTLMLVLRSDLPGVPQDVSARFATMPTIRADVNTVSRLNNVDLALAEWRSKPLLGWGTDGFHINHPENLSALPIPQLGALYDTGLIGCVLLMAVIGALLFRSVAASTRADDEATATILGALIIAAIAQLVAFQATDAFWLGFIWVYFGLMLGAVRLINEGARD